MWATRPNSRPLRSVLECFASIERPRLAGALLFLSARWRTFVARAALCGVESRAREVGAHAGRMGVVERTGALRSRRRVWTLEDVMEQHVERRAVEELPAGG